MNVKSLYLTNQLRSINAYKLLLLKEKGMFSRTDRYVNLRIKTLKIDQNIELKLLRHPYRK